jgi:hypothetical protein
MAALSSYLENALLNAVLRNTAFTSPTTVYLALYTTNPTASDTGTEVTGGSYTRQVVTFSAPSGGTAVNSADVNFPGMPAITIGWVGIRSASTAGNLLFYGALAAAKTTNAGDTFTVKAGDLNAALQ